MPVSRAFQSYSLLSVGVYPGSLRPLRLQSPHPQSKIGYHCPGLLVALEDNLSVIASAPASCLSVKVRVGSRASQPPFH